VSPDARSLTETGGCNGCGYHPEDPDRAAAFVLIVGNFFTRFCPGCAGYLRAQISDAVQRDPRVPGVGAVGRFL
jgi:hypothetical protein